MWLLYQTLFLLSHLLVAPVLLTPRGRKYRESLRVRLGAQPLGRLDRPLWIHAVSVGEVAIARTLVGALPEDLPVLLTTVTRTGQERARTIAAERRLTQVTYLPFDIGPVVGRFYDRFDPRALVLIEGELWPGLLRHAERRGLDAFVVNARLSDRSFRRMKRLRLLASFLTRSVTRFGVQTPEDLRRYLAVGVDEGHITVTGNLKFEAAEPPPNRELETLMKELAAGRPIVVAGSTMQDEEPLVLRALRDVEPAARPFLVLAPRHPERFDEAARAAAELGLHAARRTMLEESPERPDLLLLDTIGELASSYRAADGAFVGGTLVPTGGHNPIEPARFGTAVCAGPSMSNFREIERLFDAAHAWERVSNAEQLARLWTRWTQAPAGAAAVGEAALDLVAKHKGALERTLEMLGGAHGG